MKAATAKGKTTPTSAVKPMFSPLARETVMAEAMVSAEQAAIRSPNRLPVPIESQTMMRMPRIIAAMARSVAGRGRSPRKSQDSSAANMVLKARMKTRFAVVVL